MAMQEVYAFIVSKTTEADDLVKTDMFSHCVSIIIILYVAKHLT